MSTEVRGEVANVADLLHRLGGVPPRRVVLDPPPGQATEADLLRLLGKTDRLYELVDGTLVEKAMGCKEGLLAGRIIRLLAPYLEEHDLGEVGAGDTLLRILPGLVRIPDVAFFNWERLPGGQLPEEPIPDLVPDLAIEVLSKGNTKGEMRQKLKEYFLAGVTIVWLVDPVKRIVTTHTAPDVATTCTEADTLDGGSVLPGLALPVKRIFARLANASDNPRRTSRKKRS